jgi:nitroreductase
VDCLETIYTRRSIRKYADKKVPDEIIEKLLKAGMSGPSAVNEQPWHFIIVKDKKLLEEIPKASPYAQMAKEAALAIIVCGDLKLQKIEGLWSQDCCIAAQNILLAAHALGLGAVWTAAYPLPDRVENLQKLFNIPKNIIPLCVIPIGYPAEKKEPVERFKKDRVHQDKW